MVGLRLLKQSSFHTCAKFDTMKTNANVISVINCMVGGSAGIWRKRLELGWEKGRLVLDAARVQLKPCFVKSVPFESEPSSVAVCATRK